jgi:hypothetical protein
MSFGPQPISKAVCHYSDYNRFGCPVCQTGEKSGHVVLSLAGCTLFVCANCGVGYLVCADELERVPSRLPNYNEMTIPLHPLDSITQVP